MAGLIDLNGLGHFKAKENAMVADTYSASKTYAVGDYVYYNGTLYRCTTAISTAEAWTAGHWTAVKLADDCSSLKTAIIDLTGTTINLNTTGCGRYSANNSTGVIAPTTSAKIFGMGDKIPCDGNTTYTVTIFGITYAKTSIYQLYYDVNGDFISPSVIKYNQTAYNFTFTTPSTAKYLYFYIYTSTDITVPDSAKLQVEEGAGSTAYMPPVSAVDYVARRNLDNVSAWVDGKLPLPESYFINYSDGALVGSQGSNTYTINNIGYKKIRFYGYDVSNTVALIGFYSGETPSTSNYIKASSKQNALQGFAHWVEADVPENAKLICLASSKPTASYTSKFQFLTSDVGAVINEVGAKINADASYFSPFSDLKYIDHLFVGQVTSDSTSNIIIPCQSIFHIALSARLGFKYIEANVQRTATEGKYIVTHGISGKLGKDFQDLNGDAVTDVVIANTSYADLRANYRYISQYEQYQVPPTSLEEFLYACRENNMYPMLQYRDKTVLDIARGIVGNNMILYQGDRNVYDGFITFYRNYDTKAEILAECEEIGAPYIYGMDNPEDFTDEELADIINSVHKLNCYVSISSAYESEAQAQRCYQLGIDYDSVGSKVNPFESGNLANHVSGVGFSDFTTNGTASGGNLSLTTGQTVTTQAYSGDVLKYMIKIMFNGTLTINGTSLTSDGLHVITLTGFSINTTNSLSITATANTDILSLKYVVSKC